MDQARADEVIARLTTWLDEGGQLEGIRGRFGGGPGLWHDRDPGEIGAEESGA